MSEPMSTKEGLTSAPSAGQSAEGPAQLPTGGQLELAATHAENAGVEPEPRDLTPQDVERMFGPAQPPASPLERLIAQGVRVEPSLTEMGGGEARTQEEREFIRQWRKGWIAMGPDRLQQAIAGAERRLASGELSSANQRLEARQPGGGVVGVDASLGEYLDQLRLAYAVYQSPEAAARSLRLSENLVVHEIDQFHQHELRVGAGNKQYAVRNGQNAAPITIAEYANHLDKIQRSIEESPELRAFRLKLEALKNEFGEAQLRSMKQRVRRHEIVGLMPEDWDLPLFVRLQDAIKELRRKAPERDGMSMEDEIKAMEQLAEEERIKRARELGLGFAREEIGGEYYIGMYQEAWDEFCEALNTFPADVQDEIIVNYIIGGSMLGGQFAQFYRKGVEQRGRFPSKWSAWLSAIELNQKIGTIEGYIPPEHIFQSLGSVKPEILAFPDFHTSNHEIYLAGDEQARHFSLSSRDMIGQLGKISTLARMGVNNAYTSRTGFIAVRNGEFADYLFRQMGFSPAQARAIAYEDADPPTLIRDRWLSPVRRREITNIWDWVGEVALDKLVVAMAWLKWARADVEFVPLDVRRRAILSLRSLELAHYRVGYSIGSPPEQFLSMIALFPSAISLGHKEMLGWARTRLGEGRQRSEVIARRLEIWDQTVTVSRPALSSTRHLSRMVLGLESYNLRGDEYRRAVDQGLRALPPAYSEGLRHPDVWKWRWFENADADPSQWRYIGTEYTEAQMREAFEGMDFTPQLEACGLSGSEIRGMPTSGYEGWKSLLQHATLGLLEWKALAYTAGDRNWRYEPKKEKAQDAALEFLEQSSPITPRELRKIDEAASTTGQLADLIASRGGRSFRYIDEKTGTAREVSDTDMLTLRATVSKSLGELIKTSRTLGFVLNTTQQAFLESMMWMYAEGHCAHDLNEWVEDVNADSDKLAGGVNWSVPLITRQDVVPDRIPALLRAGFYFVRLPDSGIEYLISPLSAPLPKLVRSKDLLNKLERGLSHAPPSQVDRAGQVLSSIRFMRRQKAFCWDTLINGNTDIPPATLIRVLRELQEEGTLTVASRGAMQRELLKFSSVVHPLHAAEIDDKNIQQFIPMLH